MNFALQHIEKQKVALTAGRETKNHEVTPIQFCSLALH